MSFRTVVISQKAKLSYKDNFLVIQNDDLKMVHLSEINTLIVESTMVQISAYLLAQLSANKIKLIICDERHNPTAELVPYYSNYNTSKKIINQAQWQTETKQALWTKIISNKILNQSRLLRQLGIDRFKMLEQYLGEIELDDVTNREGHAAKVYFNSLFGLDFSRDKVCDINMALDYGYTILLSAFNRAISGLGYANQLGIKHKNEYNFFNLGCDLMEPFRVIVDEFVYNNKERIFGVDYKRDLVQLLNKNINFCDKNMILTNAINVFVINALRAVDDNRVVEYLVYEYGV